jgi:hypothetical protein
MFVAGASDESLDGIAWVALREGGRLAGNGKPRVDGPYRRRSNVLHRMYIVRLSTCCNALPTPAAFAPYPKDANGCPNAEDRYSTKTPPAKPSKHYRLLQAFRSNNAPS